jgi:hypothetical protein
MENSREMGFNSLQIRTSGDNDEPLVYTARTALDQFNNCKLLKEDPVYVSLFHIFKKQKQNGTQFHFTLN